MPFTVSHAAAALPFRRSPLIPSALVAGTFAPDIEYFLRLAPGGGWGHTIPGAFGLSLPLGLVTLWFFHRFVKLPATMLLPGGLQQRLEPGLHPFRFGGLRRFVMIVLSLLVGIATHLIWDEFTHVDSWMYIHVEFLRHVVKLPLMGWENYASILQYMSSVGGLAVLAVWFAHWYRDAQPAAAPVVRPLSSALKFTIVGLMTVIAAIGGFLRAYLYIGMPNWPGSKEFFLGYVIVTFIAIIWWELVAWGFLLRPHRIRHEQPMDKRSPLQGGTSDVA